MIPILGAGHFNVTRKNITEFLSKNKYALLGFSSYSCDKCIQAEPEYEKIAAALGKMKIPFARANADDLKSITAEFGAQAVPSLVFVQKNKPTLYKGVHSVEAVTRYIEKQTGPPVKKLATIEAVQAFFASRSQPQYSISTIMTVGFFSQHEDIEEDEYEDFLEVAKDLQGNEDIYFGVVTNKAVVKYFKTNKTIDRTPSLVLYGEDEQKHAINLDELYGEKTSMKDWLLKQAVPLIGKLTPLNFAFYEKLNIPMLLLCLDLKEEMQSAQPGKVVGGKSGGILNEVLLDELRYAAKEHIGRIVMVYLDGNLYEDQMRSLGLYGGKERLPGMAFNTRDRSQVPFPEELPLNKDTILQFCADFISGKLHSPEDTKEMAKKALQRAVPLDTRNKAERKAPRQAPDVVQGVSEQWGDGIVGDKAALRVNEKNFDEIVMNEEKDVVLLLHAKGCESCAHFNVYFKRMSQRFKDLQINSLVLAQMDVTSEAPPAQYQMMVGNLPLLLMVPANAKHAPWSYFSGIGKVQSMMKWVQKHASIPFALPNLPHLNDEQVKAYKEQVREREERLEQKRNDEKKAMAEEERAQKEMQRRKRKQQAEAETDEDEQESEVDAQSKQAKFSADEMIRKEEDDAEDFGMDEVLPDHGEF